MLGITFKENCPDVRNTKIVDVITSLKDYGIVVTIYDPLANVLEVKHEYDLVTTAILPCEKFDAVVLGVAHSDFFNINIKSLQKEFCILYDVKGVLSEGVDGKL